ncbi:MAG: hypothetical protein KDI36_01415, partial [Pseudomonadales bacterium]|nr:hypothetical protein [Pseudomonadales bacterium]
MPARAICLTILMFSLLFSSVSQAAQPEQIEWDLSEIFADEAAWESEFERLSGELEKLSSYQGTLGKSAAKLQQARDDISNFSKALVKLYVYASMRSDEDLRNAENLERLNKARGLYARFGQSVSWFDPELLTVGSKKVEKFIRQNKGLEKHAFDLRDILRQEAHTLGLEAEGVLANSGEVLSGSNTAYSLLANAAIPWPEMEIDGETVRLDASAYTKHRANPDREVRKAVFEKYWQEWNRFEAPLGQLLDTHVKGHVFLARSRKYDNALSYATSGSNIPTAVYEKLVEQVNRNLPSFHRYLKLRQRMLGLPDMHYYDIYPETVSLDREFGLDEARQMMLTSLAPFGDEYLDLLRKGFAGNWMHVYPQ